MPRQKKNDGLNRGQRYRLKMLAVDPDWANRRMRDWRRRNRPRALESSRRSYARNATKRRAEGIATFQKLKARGYSEAYRLADRMKKEARRAALANTHAESYVQGQVHTNGAENFWSLLKRGINGTYISVEPFHLFRYVDEQAFRFNEREDEDGDAGRFARICSQAPGRRLTWKRLTGKENEQALSAQPA